MLSDTILLENRRKSAFLFVMSGLALSALLLSAATLVANQCDSSAMRILDDPQTEHLDVVDLSTENFGVYADAIAMLKWASVYAPLNSGYEKKVSELYFRMALWNEAMSQMGSAAPDTMTMSGQFRSAAFRHMKKAVRLDPASASLRLALGQVYSVSGEREKAREQLLIGIKLYPVNAEIRFGAAVQLLLMGMPDEAREQARLLAQIDDSYRIDEADPRMALAREQRSPWYESRLSSSYLFKAFEIIWRTSKRDRVAIEQATPPNADAKEVLRLFWEEKANLDQ